MTDEKPVIYKYRLPDETVVDIPHDAVKGEAEIDYTLEGGAIVKAVRVPELEEGYNAPEPVDPVNPIEAAAALQALEPGAVIEYKPIDVLPAHLIRLRDAARTAELEYDRSAEETKDAKKAWEKARETFEAAFDAETRRQADGKTPGLPFDGVHMGDIHGDGAANTAPATEEKGPAEVRQFPRAVPPATDEPEPPCHQCGHPASEHDKTDDIRGACTHTEKNATDDDETCACGLYELPPAAAAEPEPAPPTTSDPTVH